MLIPQIDDDREWIQWWIEDEEWDQFIDRWKRENEFHFYPAQRRLLESPAKFLLYGGMNGSPLKVL